MKRAGDLIEARFGGSWAASQYRSYSGSYGCTGRDGYEKRVPELMPDIISQRDRALWRLLRV